MKLARRRVDDHAVRRARRRYCPYSPNHHPGPGQVSKRQTRAVLCVCVAGEGTITTHGVSLLITCALITFNVYMLRGGRRGSGPLLLFLAAGAPLVLANPLVRITHELGSQSDRDLPPEIGTLLTYLTWAGSIAMMISTLWNMNADRRLRAWFSKRHSAPKPPPPSPSPQQRLLVSDKAAPRSSDAVRRLNDEALPALSAPV